jgi:hypothetical protein
MGACFNDHTFDGKLTIAELTKAYNAYVEELRDEYGTDPYNGTLSTLSGVTVREDKTFESYNEASEYVANNTQKWENALAVRYKDTGTEFTKKPTFNGSTDDSRHIRVVLGVDCELEELRASHECKAIVRLLAPLNPNAPPSAPAAVADQLTASQKDKLLKLYNEWAARRQTFNQLSADLCVICERLKIAHQEPKADDFSQLKKLHTRRKKAWAALKKAAIKLRDADLKLGARLYKSQHVDHGTRWLVGGWCAE